MVKVDEKCILFDLFNYGGIKQSMLSDTSTFLYDFTMCNPPFFSTDVEAWSVSHPATSSNSAHTSERVYPGGEVYFVRKMIMESVKVKDKIRSVKIKI